LGGKYLVFVYYPPTHPAIDEWVFNGAEIPGAPIVFARLVNPSADDRLARAMSGYEVLRVNAQTEEITWPQDDLAKFRHEVVRAVISYFPSQNSGE
jgi:hypothetical protein